MLIQYGLMVKGGLSETIWKMGMWFIQSMLEI